MGLGVGFSSLAVLEEADARFAKLVVLTFLARIFVHIILAALLFKPLNPKP